MPSQNTSSSETASEASISAADIRVTADEFNAAMAAIESRRERETEAHEAAVAREQSTIKIGEVISELKLDVTPDEIYDEVRRSRQPFEPYGTGLLEELPDQPYPEPEKKLPDDSPQARLAIAEAYVKGMPMSYLESYDQLTMPRMLVDGIQKQSSDLHKPRFSTAYIWVGLLILWILSALFASFHPAPPPTPVITQSQHSTTFDPSTSSK